MANVKWNEVTSATDTLLYTEWQDMANTIVANTSDSAFINALTVTTTELNYSDGVTSNIQTQIDTNTTNITTNTGLITTNSDFIGALTATTTELNYTDGVTSAIQTQLDSKGTGTMSDLVDDTTPTLGGDLDVGAFDVGAANSADLILLNQLTASSTELNYVTGVTSAIQTQITDISSDLDLMVGYVETNTGFINSLTSTTAQLNYLSTTTSDVQTQINNAGGGSSSPLTTKGDIYTYDSADARLAIGTNDQVLTADSAEATGMKWATAGSGGGTASYTAVVAASGGDYTTIAAAISAGETTIFIRDGTYAESLTITNTGTTLIGESRKGVIIAPTSGENINGSAMSNFELRNLTLKRTAAASTDELIRWLGDWTGFKLINCDFIWEDTGNIQYGGVVGLSYQGSGAAFIDVQVIGCYFKETGGGGSGYEGGMLRIDNSSVAGTINGIVIDGNTFNNDDGSSTSMSIALTTGQDSATTYMGNISITNNSIWINDAGTNHGIDIGGRDGRSASIKNVAITGNTINISGGTDVGINLRTDEKTLQYITISGNSIIADTAIKMTQSSSGVIDAITIVGNTLDAATHISTTGTATNVLESGLNNEV